MSATTLITAVVTALAAALLGFLVARLRGERALAHARAEAAGLQARLDAEQRSAAEKVAVLEQAHVTLTERFRALSAEALEQNNRSFLELADTRLKEAGARAAGDLEQRRQAVEHLVAPLRETLAKVEVQLRDIEHARGQAQSALAAQIDFVRQTGEDLRRETASLVTALRRPQTRGQWGEMQLRRVVEVAGMVEHCDFDLQASVTSADGTQRPDMVVRLAGGKNVVVDAKVPLTAFLDAAEAPDEATRAERLTAHARHLRTHVDSLAAKSYWQRLSPTPEFVVLFVPGEAFLAQALETDAALLEHAASRKVVLATPTTLIALLRTVAYAWTQAALADNALSVFELGRELYARIGNLGEHVDKLGRALTGAVTAYNKTVGSLESRVLVSARKLRDLKVVEAELPPVPAVDTLPRPLAADELVQAAELARPVVVLPPALGGPAGDAAADPAPGDLSAGAGLIDGTWAEIVTPRRTSEEPDADIA